MTPIQKAKEIFLAAWEYWRISAVESPSLTFDNWTKTDEGKQLLSGEDWKEGQWEYSVRPAFADWNLGELGKEGWQLCAVNDKYYYFKRPLPEPPKP